MMRNNVRRVVTVILACTATVMQAKKETLSVATLNVDGLPQKILFFDVNATGPGATYTPLISQYLASKNYDIIGVQEDFNFDSQLCSALNDGYQHDEWSGGIANGTGGFGLGNVKYSCDGLLTFWKTNITMKATVRTNWHQAYGKFDHCWDDMVTKSFRRYEMLLAGGTEVVVYNLHMDASDDPDGLVDTDTEGDRAARRSQWIQLRDDIIARMDQRPVLVIGDTNSFYSSDDLEQVFIKAIEETGMATVGDVWVELALGGKYPEAQESNMADDGTLIGWKHDKDEWLDKILYINPTQGSKLRPLAVTLDREGFLREDGTPLCDHYPLAATFEVSDQTATVISNVGDNISNAALWSPNGTRLTSPRRGITIVRNVDGSTTKVVTR